MADCSTEGSKRPGPEVGVSYAGLAVEKPLDTIIVETPVYDLRKTDGKWQAGKKGREGQQGTQLFLGYLSSEASVSH